MVYKIDRRRFGSSRSHAESLTVLFVALAQLLELLETNEVLLLFQDGIVEVLGRLVAQALLLLKVVLALLQRHINGTQRLRNVRLELFLLLLGATLLVVAKDLVEVLALLSEQLLRLVHRVVQVVVSLLLLGLEVHILEQLDESLVELRQLDVGRAVLDATAQLRDVYVFLRNQLLLLHELLVLGLELSVDFGEDSGVLLSLHLFLLLGHLCELLVESTLLLFALLLELALFLGEAGLLFDQCLHNHDLVLTYSTRFDLGLEPCRLLGHLLNLLLVLLTLVLQLGHLFGDTMRRRLHLLVVSLLLGEALLELTDFLFVLLLLLLVHKNRVVANDLFVHLLEVLNLFGDGVNVLSEDARDVVSLDVELLAADLLDVNVEVARSSFPSGISSTST